MDDRAATGGDASDTLCTMPATELAAAVRSKQVSPVEVTDAVLARINRLNPGLNAFVTLIEDDARRQARQAEQAVMRGQELGALHGVP
ncbi:amidase family protein, partial [Candidatus Clostridium helianthi]